MYKIINTTDGKFLGRSIEEQDIKVGSHITLDDFVFEISKIVRAGELLIIAETNYVITLQEA